MDEFIDLPHYGISVNAEGMIRTRSGVVSRGNDVSGYLGVYSMGGKYSRKRLLVHRVVAEAFLGPCPEGYQVNHKNRIKTDNRISNLEYVSPRENTAHFRALLGKPVQGVCWYKGRKKWSAYIGKGGKQVNLGYFDSKEEAVTARKITEEALSWSKPEQLHSEK